MRRLLCLILVSLLLCTSALADMDVYFLDVGQADAAVILCDGAAMMIDGGNVGDSQLIYSYLKNTLSLDHLDAMIATHPHEDHIGGLPAALNAVTCDTVYSPVTEYDSETFQNLLKYAPQGLTVPEIGDTFQLGGQFYSECLQESKKIGGDTMKLTACDLEKLCALADDYRCYDDFESLDQYINHNCLILNGTDLVICNKRISALMYLLYHYILRNSALKPFLEIFSIIMDDNNIDSYSYDDVEIIPALIENGIVKNEQFRFDGKNYEAYILSDYRKLLLNGCNIKAIDDRLKEFASAEVMDASASGMFDSIYFEPMFPDTIKYGWYDDVLFEFEEALNGILEGTFYSDFSDYYSDDPEQSARSICCMAEYMNTKGYSYNIDVVKKRFIECLENPPEDFE